MQRAAENEQLLLTVNANSLLRVTVEIEGNLVEAEVDTAAEVTLISDSLYKALQNKPPKLRNVQILTFILTIYARHRGWPTQIGGKLYAEKLHDALMEDDMLHGFDFL